jgi:hypothetical protein
MTLSEESRISLAAELQGAPDHRTDSAGAYLAFVGVAERILNDPNGQPREPDRWEKSHLYYAVAALWMQHLPHAFAELTLALKPAAERDTGPISSKVSAAIDAYETDRLRYELQCLRARPVGR